MSETMSETNGNKLLFCRDSEAAFGSESATRGGSLLGPELDWGKLFRGGGNLILEPELDWGKLWRGQVFGELEAAFGSESTL